MTNAISMKIIRRFRALILSGAFLTLAAAAQALPTAVINPGPPNAVVNVGQQVTLDGTGSDAGPGGFFITLYTWDLPPGTPQQTTGFNFPFTFTVPSVAGPGHQTVTVRLTVQNAINETAFTDDPFTVNRLPVANAQNPSTPQDTPLNITLTGADDDGDTLAFAAVSNPAHGQLSGTAPNLVYTPNPGFVGTDSFVFQVNDGFGTSNATVSITVLQVNHPPVANNQSVNAPEDVPTPINMTGFATDPDGNALTYLIVSGPIHGALSGTPPNVVYTSSPNYNGADSFTFRARDNGIPPLTSNDATVSITVTPTNDAPVANAGPDQTVVEQSPVSLKGDGSTDPEGDVLTFAWVQTSGPAVTLSNANIANPTFTGPILDSNTDLTFQLTVTDPGPLSSSDTVVIHVLNFVSGNHPPTNVNAGANANVVAGSSVTLAATAVDPDNDPLTYGWQQIGGPVVTIANPSAQNTTFLAPLVADGTLFTFQVTVTDGRGGVGTASVQYRVFNAPAGQLPQNPVISELAVFPSPFSASVGATIRYQLREASDVTILIVDLFGHTVREFTSTSGSISGSGGINEFHWDGKNGEGNKIGNGAYVVQVRANGISGAKGKVNERVGVRN